ncbi:MULTISPECIES: hypothetical protein [unclassified Bradyrhizobium]
MTDQTTVHTFYDFAKDFQPTFAAVIALSAASLAYWGVMAKISYDKAVAETARHAARISLCTRLKLRTRPIAEYAKFVSDWLEMEQARVSLQEVEDQMKIWPAAPSELEEAWQHLDAIPIAAIDALDALRDQMKRMEYVSANPHEENEKWQKFQIRTIVSVAKQVALHADALIKALEEEIAAIRRT